MKGSPVRVRASACAAESQVSRKSRIEVRSALQRSIGNRAVAQVLARTPITTGSVQIRSVGEVRVKGGNHEEWAGKGAPDTVDVTSEKGKHSAKLEKLSMASRPGGWPTSRT